MKRLAHEVIGGSYSNRREIILDACYIDRTTIEVMALSNGNEMEVKQFDNDEAAALDYFAKLVHRYAGNFQKAVYGKLQRGEKYTLAYLNEFGWPVTQKIKFESAEFTSYAQHSDVVKMIFTPYRKRSLYQKYFYNQSLMIFKGWQDLEMDKLSIITERNGLVIRSSKYSCFDARYIDEMEELFADPVLIYKDFKQGANGKIYA